MKKRSDELLFPLEPGVSFTIVYEHFPDCRYHVRGVVDGFLVVRTWSRKRQAWYYTVERPDWYRHLFRKGKIKNIRKERIK